MAFSGSLALGATADVILGLYYAAQSPVVRVPIVQAPATDGTGGSPPAESLTTVDVAVLAVAVAALVLSVATLIRRRGGGNAAKKGERRAPKP